jgi:PAS domain S-box-containing protein
MQRELPSTPIGRSLARHAIAVLGVAMAVLLRAVIPLGDKVTYITFYPAVMAAAVLGGLWPGILATGLSGLAAEYWLIAPSKQFAIDEPADALGLVLFCCLGVLMSGMAEAYRHTRSKAAEYEKQLAVRESETKYRELVENANSAIVRWTRDGRITFFNEYAQRFFGYRQEDVIGRHASILMPDTESTGRDLTAILDDIVSNPEAYVNNVNENVLRDGSRVWMTWTNKPIFDANGWLVEILSVGSDITQQKAAEAALREVEEHKRDFYRRTILAATGGKLLVCERRQVEDISGRLLASWEVTDRESARTALDAMTQLAQDNGMSKERSYEFVGCVTEATTNAIKHAHGGTVSLHLALDRLVCVVSDEGPGIGAMALPDVALTKNYSTAGTLGMGYKVMIHFADRVYLATGPAGTTVAIEMTLKKDESPVCDDAAICLRDWEE